MNPAIQVGQVWRTRGGAFVRITRDRGPEAINPCWRWALSNSFIAHEDDGRVELEPGWKHHSDLVELVEHAPRLSDASVKGMDSTMGGLTP